MKSILSVVRKCIAVIGSVAMMITLMTVIIPTQPAAAESACVKQAWTRLNNTNKSCKLAASPGNMQTMYFRNQQTNPGIVKIEVVPMEMPTDEGTCSDIKNVTIPAATTSDDGNKGPETCTTLNRDYILSIVLNPDNSQQVFYLFTQPVPLRLPQ